MFDGVYPYQQVLEILGILLFVMLAVVMFVYVYQKRPLTSLLPYFFLPLVMIGLPAFQSFKFKSDFATIEATLKTVDRNPNDAQARAALQQQLQQVGDVRVQNPQVNLTLARAFKAVGKPDQARDRANAALKLDPNLRAAKQLQEALGR
jgi:hypothetical protein